VTATGVPINAGTATRTYEFTTSVEAAVQARELLAPVGSRLDLIFDLAAILLGVAVVAMGSLVGFVLIAIAAGALVSRRPIHRWAFGRQYRSMLGKRARVTVGDDALLFASEVGSSEVPWSAITAVRSNDRTVIFLRDRLLAGYIPAASFASKAEQADLVHFASERIGDERQVRRG
jgi:hypothetical protein